MKFGRELKCFSALRVVVALESVTSTILQGCIFIPVLFINLNVDLLTDYFNFN